MLNKKKMRTIAGILCCLAGTIIFVGCYLVVNLQAKRVDLSTIESVLSVDIANLNVIEVCQDRFGITKIIFETKHKDMKYTFYNYTQGEGEGEYKNVALGTYNDANELWELPTYPYGAETDTYIAYASNELFERMKIAVIFQNVDGERFIYRLENTYEVDKE